MSHVQSRLWKAGPFLYDRVSACTSWTYDSQTAKPEFGILMPGSWKGSLGTFSDMIQEIVLAPDHQDGKEWGPEDSRRESISDEHHGRKSNFGIRSKRKSNKESRCLGNFRGCIEAM